MKITKDGKVYVAVDEKTNTATQGRTRKEAERNLEEALELYYENDNIWKLRPEYVKKIKRIEKRGKFVHFKNVDELFKKSAKKG
jgi:predicted RNase H-like HicB family nuclease